MTKYKRKCINVGKTSFADENVKQKCFIVMGQKSEEKIQLVRPPLRT